jgi:hypothetical protein
LKIKFIKTQPTYGYNFGTNIWFYYECPITLKQTLLFVLPVTSTLWEDSVLEEVKNNLEAKYGEEIELEEIHNPILNK